MRRPGDTRDDEQRRPRSYSEVRCDRWADAYFEPVTEEQLEEWRKNPGHIDLHEQAAKLKCAAPED